MLRELQILMPGRFHLLQKAPLMRCDDTFIRCKDRVKNASTFQRQTFVVDRAPAFQVVGERRPSIRTGARCPARRHNPIAAYCALTAGKTYVASTPEGSVKQITPFSSIGGKIDGGGQPGAGSYIRIIKRMSVLTFELAP